MQGNNPQNQYNVPINNGPGWNWNYDGIQTTAPSQQNWINNGQQVAAQQMYPNTPPVASTQPSTPQRFVLPGRLVNDISEVQINEIPMDGSRNVFPLSDLSKVYLKFWDNDGQFKTKTYILVDDESQNVSNQNQTQMDEVMSKITSLESMVRKILKQSYRKPQKGGNDNAK